MSVCIMSQTIKLGIYNIVSFPPSILRSFIVQISVIFVWYNSYPM